MSQFMPQFNSIHARLLCAAAVLALSAPLAQALGTKPVEDEEKIIDRIHPVARVEMAAKPAAAPGARSGEEIVKGVCNTCHQTGVAGAPKIGDKAAWAPRLAQGLDGLVKSATAGKNAMPPKGGADLTPAELTRAIVFISNKSGASFKEPADKK
ncbi:MAG: c-type cytochrome [Sterolibacterium sp.]